MTIQENAHQEQEPNNEEVTEQEETETDKKDPEHYEEMVDDAILGAMEDSESS